MNWLDFVILITLIPATFIGLWKGFVRFVLYAFGLILGITLGVKYASKVAHLLFTTPPDWAGIAGFAIIFISVLLLSFLLAFIIRRILSRLMLGWVDRVLGAFFALGLAVFIWGLLLTFVSVYASLFPFLEVIKDFIQQSAVACLILDLTEDFLNFILLFLPKEWQSIT